MTVIEECLEKIAVYKLQLKTAKKAEVEVLRQRIREREEMISKARKEAEGHK